MFHCTLIVVLLAALAVTQVNAQAYRIIGGVRLPDGNAPYLVSLTVRGRHVCGGTIVGNRSIVTAAHCVSSLRSKDMAIRAGSNFVKTGGVVVKVASYKSHPSFRLRTFNYDIAMVYLSQALNFTNKIRSVQLFSREARDSETARISGWGVKSERGRRPSNVALTTGIRVMSRRRCKRVYKRLLQRTMICAGVPSGARDACQGDSGGPLMMGGRLAGVISAGFGCGRRGRPGIYTNVPMLRSWITRNI